MVGILSLGPAIWEDFQREVTSLKPADGSPPHPTCLSPAELGRLGRGRAGALICLEGREGLIRGGHQTEAAGWGRREGIVCGGCVPSSKARRPVLNIPVDAPAVSGGENRLMGCASAQVSRWPGQPGKEVALDP